MTGVRMCGVERWRMNAANVRAILDMKAEAPSHVPLELFQQAARCSAVTYAESRVYDWLLRDHWLHVKPPRTGLGVAPGEMLRARFLAGSQLLVEWNGNPHSPQRRLVL